MERETKLRWRQEGPFQKAKTDRDGLHAMLRPESRNAKTVPPPPPHTHNALPILLLSFSPSPFCDSVQQCQGRGRHINSAFLNGGGGRGFPPFSKSTPVGSYRSDLGGFTPAQTLSKIKIRALSLTSFS